MSIIPASRLSASDLALLGNNVSPSHPRRRPERQRELTAVNRSLCRFGEQVSHLHVLPATLAQAPAPVRH